MVCSLAVRRISRQSLTILGPIYELRLATRNLIVVSNYELFNEICDEKRFGKNVSGPLVELRAAIHDGLFTAHTSEHAWEVAHRILVPSFGPLAIRDMFDGQYYIEKDIWEAIECLICGQKCMKS